MTFSIRKATKGDLKHLAKMNKTLIQDEGSSNPMTLAQLEERMGEWMLGEWEIEIILDKTMVIGYAVYQIRADDFYTDEKYIYLRQFYVEREHRSKGYGTGALRHLIDTCFPKGAQVQIDVLESNPRGQKFWEMFGFEPYCTSIKLTKLPGMTDIEINL